MHTECLALQSSGAQEPPTLIEPTASTISSSVILTAALSNFSAPSNKHRKLLQLNCYNLSFRISLISYLTIVLRKLIFIVFTPIQWN